MKDATFLSIKSKYLLYSFFFGIIIGTLFFNLFMPDYFDEIGIFGNYFVDKFNALEIDKSELFTYAFFSRIKEMILILIFSFTIINFVYNILYCLFLGFSTGLFISSLTISSGLKGVWYYVVSISPHYLIYVLLIIFTLSKSIQINHHIYKKNNYKDNSLKVMDGKGIILNILLIFSIIFIMCIVEAYLEVYINTALLKKILRLF